MYARGVKPSRPHLVKRTQAQASVKKSIANFQVDRQLTPALLGLVGRTKGWRRQTLLGDQGVRPVKTVLRGQDPFSRRQGLPT
jgi:hypothetical protein